MTEDKLDKLRLLYELYIRYGGYPAVIRNYMESKDLEEATVVLSNMLELIQRESNHFCNAKHLLDKLFYPILERIVTVSVYGQENKNKLNHIHSDIGYQDISLDQMNIQYHNNTLSKIDIQTCVKWLIHCGIVGEVFCTSLDNKTYTQRIYIEDCGILFLLSTRLKLNKGNFIGALTETFAFTEINRACSGSNTFRSPIQEREAKYSRTGDYELDILLHGNTLCDNADEIYGIEIKAGTDVATSLEYYKQNKLITKAIYASGDNTIDLDSSIIKIPNFLVGILLPYHSYNTVELNKTKELDSKLKSLNIFTSGNL